MSEESNEAPGAEAETWNLVLFPKFAEGEDPVEVKKRLSTTLKVDAKKVEGWFHAEAPTLLLKGVDKDVADRYMEAILQCGATCNVQSSKESDGLALVPKSRNVDFFICPSCEYEEEVPRGTKYEQCPKCGLLIAKWEEKMREEREREALRRRNLRRKQDDEGDTKRKLEQLERLRSEEKELMQELGMKVPGRFWMFFEKYPIPVSVLFVLLIVGLSTVVLYYVNQHLMKERHAALLAAQPSAQIQSIAPVLAAAVKLQENGDEPTLNEMANVTTLMRGRSGSSREQIIEAAQQMMKGADAGQFVSAAGHMNLPARTTRAEPNGAKPTPVNTGSIGGISGIKGVGSFDTATLDEIAPPELEHGHDKILQILGERRVVADPKNPKKKITVDEIDELDGSMIVDLMNSLQADQEWDQFLRDNVDVFLKTGKTNKASTLAEEIANPVIRIAALGDIMVKMLNNNPHDPLKAQINEVLLEKDKIKDADTRAKAVLDLGVRLAVASDDRQPAASIDTVEDMVKATKDPFDKALATARIAVVESDMGDRAQAGRHFNAALNMAGRVNDPTRRILTFTRIAERYYDVRDTTIASKILEEAQLIAATQLGVADRSKAFGEVAMAQGYMGDIPGALASIRNAATGKGVQQLQARLADTLIRRGRYYQAQSVLDGLADPVQYNRLEIRLIGDLLHSGKLDQARTRLLVAGDSVNKITDPAARGMMMSQYGRLSERAGEGDEAKLFFKEALGMSDQLSGRKRALNRGLVALDEARALLIDKSKDTLGDIRQSIIKDPIQSEILSADRIARNLLPASALPKKKKSVSQARSGNRA